MGRLPRRERLAVAGTDDERPVARVVEVRRVGGLVAAHADGGRHLRRDVARRILRMLARGAVAHLALHVLPPFSAAREPGAADLRSIDAAHPARLLPAGDMAADAVEAELLARKDQRLVSVRVARLRPEARLGLVTLGARLHLPGRRDPRERRFAPRRWRA